MNKYVKRLRSYDDFMLDLPFDARTRDFSDESGNVSFFEICHLNPELGHKINIYCYEHNIFLDDDTDIDLYEDISDDKKLAAEIKKVLEYERLLQNIAKDIAGYEMFEIGCNTGAKYSIDLGDKSIDIYCDKSFDENDELVDDEICIASEEI